MYINPKTVVAPRSRWALHDVICDTGDGGWSAATGTWDGQNAVAIRWNGETGGNSGSPQSHGNPTWFIVPPELVGTVLEKADRLNRTKGAVKVDLSRPDGWDFGVYKVEIALLGDAASIATSASMPIIFELPTLPKRLFRPVDNMMDYFVPPQGQGEPWHGKLIDGKWEAIVQTNGVAEESNPVPIEIVGANLKANVVNVISALY